MSDTLAAPVTAEVNAAAPPRHRLKTWGHILSQFLAGQACLQVVNAVTGFLLLRWLTITAYAQYSIAFGFQSMFAMLVDLGFSGTIVALVGDRVDDKAVVGKYIRAAQHFRSRLFIGMTVIASVAYPVLVYKHHWNVTTNVLLFSTIISSIFFQGWGMYVSPLVMHRQMKQVYGPQIASSIWRIALCFVFHILGQLSAWATALFNTAALALSGLLMRRNANSFIVKPKQSDPVSNREMLHYLSPGIPGIVFGAFQGQITLALIAIFGHTANIAEVAALSRLGQVFIVLAAFNGVIIEPYIAKISAKQLWRRYIQIVSAAVTLSTALLLLAVLVPNTFLLLLGSKYQHLRHEVGWVVLASCLTYLSQVLWAMHSARRWVYWWATLVYIFLLLSVQIGCVLIFNISTTAGVIYISVATAGAVLLQQILIGGYGFICQSRRSNNSLTT